MVRYVAWGFILFVHVEIRSVDICICVGYWFKNRFFEIKIYKYSLFTSREIRGRDIECEKSLIRLLSNIYFLYQLSMKCKVIQQYIQRGNRLIHSGTCALIAKCRGFVVKARGYLINLVYLAIRNFPIYFDKIWKKCVQIHLTPF